MNVEIWSDVICPWCYIGKRQFEEVLKHFPHGDQVAVIWRSYQIDPEAPKHPNTSMDKVQMTKQFGDPALVKVMIDRISTLAAEAGLEYNLEKIVYSNSFDAQRLIHFAATKQVQDAVLERLLKAYFTDGAAIGDQEVLVQIASELGLDADETRSLLAGEAYTHEVNADIKRARMLGIQGLPFFLIDEKYSLTGIQPANVLTDALEKAWLDAHPLIDISGNREETGACEIDNGCFPTPNQNT
ncbi:DSBA oxidoreductase [Ktedonobacteria bacterium brp13]|nr:DSBA oxidoreductase [Ktedonobacteria bacterium brp13]